MGITAYYDASGHEDDSLFVSVVGALASQEAWAEFEKEWKAVLDAENIKEFHHADFKASEGEFRGWKSDEARRRRFVGALLDVMDRRILRWYAAGLYPRTFRRLATEFHLEALGGPFMLAALAAKILVDRWCDFAQPGGAILHIFEKGDRGQRPNVRLSDLGGDIRAYEKWHAKRGYIYGFQAADLIAGELTTLQAGLSAEPDTYKRIGRKPLTRIIQIPGEIVNLDYFTMVGVCQRFPDLFASRKLGDEACG